MNQNENQKIEGQGADIMDDMDCRPENLYPEANREAATPDYIRDMLAQKKAQPADPGEQPGQGQPSAPAQDNKNPA